MTDFNTAFDRLFDNEGGFQNDPRDPGNWTGGKVNKGRLLGTKYGISAQTYPFLDIPNITREDAKSIYKQDWWDELNMQAYPPSLTYQLFDAAVNHGIYNANKLLQYAVSAKADGIIGTRSHAAIARTEKNDLLLRFLAERLLFMTDIGIWKYNGRGWARRIAHNLIIAAKDN